MARRRPSSSSPRRYPRAARLRTLLLEIVASEVEAIDHEELTLVTITDVAVDQELDQATVYWSCLDADRDDEINEAFEEIRRELQRAIGDQASLRRVPRLSFAADPGARAAARIDDILADIHDRDAELGGGSSAQSVDETTPSTHPPDSGEGGA